MKNITLHFADFPFEKLLTLGEKLMTIVSDYAEQQAAYNVRMDKAVSDLQADMDALKAQIAALKASGGSLSQADQDALTALSAHASSMADKLDALDAANAPVPPAPAA